MIQILLKHTLCHMYNNWAFVLEMILLLINASEESKNNQKIIVYYKFFPTENNFFQNTILNFRK